jgi:hypothetical protein
MFETKGLADRIEQEGLARAAPADEQNRVTTGERGEDDGLLRLEAVSAECGQAAGRSSRRIGHAAPHRSWQDHRLRAGW